VNPDALPGTRRSIAEAEHALLLQAAREAHSLSGVPQALSLRK
jgi:hypothetical protein